jgi:predicted SAM-dependent methyltransferase
VLEHFENPLEALRIIHGLLELEGYLWVEVPNILSPNPKKTMQNWLAKEHRSYFSMNKLKEMLEHVGFEVVLEEEAHFCRMLARKIQDSNSRVVLLMKRNWY